MAEEIKELQRKLKELQEQEAAKANKDKENREAKRKQYEEGAAILEDKLKDERGVLMKRGEIKFSTNSVNVDVKKLIGTEMRAGGGEDKENVPLVKGSGFKLDEHGSKQANDILAKFGFSKDSFQYEDRGQEGDLHRDVMTKSVKYRGGLEQTTTIVSAIDRSSSTNEKTTPDFVNVTVTDPKTKTSYSQSVGTAFIDKESGKPATDDELKAAAGRLEKMLPKDAIPKQKLQDLLKQGEGVKVEIVNVTDKDGRVHSQMNLKAVDKFGNPVKQGSVLVATQTTEKSGRAGSSTVVEHTAEDLQKKGSQDTQPTKPKIQDQEAEKTQQEARAREEKARADEKARQEERVRQEEKTRQEELARKIAKPIKPPAQLQAEKPQTQIKPKQPVKPDEKKKGFFRKTIDKLRSSIQKVLGLDKPNSRLPDPELSSPPTRLASNDRVTPGVDGQSEYISVEDLRISADMAITKDVGVDPLMQMVAKLQTEGRTFDNPSATPEGIAGGSGPSQASGPMKQRGQGEGIA